MYASRVSAAAGLNKYETPEAVLEKMGLKPKTEEPYDKMTAMEKLQLCETANVTPQNSSNVSNKEVKSALDALCEAAIRADTASQSKAEEDKVHRTVAAICKSQAACPAFFTAVQQDIRSQINTQKGTLMEKELTDRLQTSTGRPVVQRNNKTYTLSLRFGDAVLHIRGRIDGLQHDLDTGETVLVETKARKNRLFEFIPVYEKVQMEVYMRMLGCHKAILNQHLQHSRAKRKRVDADAAHRSPDRACLSTVPYARDDQLWKRVVEGLQAFVERARAYGVPTTGVPTTRSDT